jgi:2-polyprenyl-6-hydroxyphenyl methylase/3-demethylubiquinone-9 3-methyltransferase
MVLEAGLTVHQSTGVSFNPLLNKWSKSGDMSVNYMAIAGKSS